MFTPHVGLNGPYVLAMGVCGQRKVQKAIYRKAVRGEARKGIGRKVEKWGR